jgi:hypothetical protein
MPNGWCCLTGGTSLATPECSSLEASCSAHLKELQSRSGPPEIHVSAKELWKKVNTTLQRAVRAELLETGQYAVSRLLRPISESGRREGGRTYEFSCGPAQDELKVPDSRDCLVRDDGAVITFSVTIAEQPGRIGLELIAYRFDLTFPPDSDGPRFIRFDLDQRHEKDGLRAHIHPGLPEGRLPSPILDPVEALHFLLVHLR